MVQHRKRIVFHVPAAIERPCAFHFLRAVREQFGDRLPSPRNVVFPDVKLATVERGRGWLSYGGRRSELAAGTIYVLFEGVPVSFGPEPAEPMEVTFAVLVGDGVADVLASVGLTPATPTVQLGPAPELREIFRELRDRRGGYVPRAHGLLWSLLARIGEASCAATDPQRLAGVQPDAQPPAGLTTPAAGFPPVHAPSTSQDPAVNRALAAVRLHLHQPELRLADLARAAYLGHSQFAARFRRAMDCTPGDYVEMLRLAEARALLADEDLSIAEVAHRAGFRDPAYFARRFRRATGESPSAFRSTARPSVADVAAPRG